MIPARFFWRLYAGTVVLILLTASLIGFILSGSVEHQARREMELDLRTKASLLALEYREARANGSEAGLQAKVEGMGRETGSRFTVVLADGTVIADSEADPARMENHGERPEIVAARGAGIGVSMRYSETVRTELMYLALPMREGDATVGFARTAIPLLDVSRRLDHVRNVVLLVASLSSVAALLLGYFFARRITGPLTEMTRKARAVAEGDYTYEFRTRSGDEIGTLARAFDVMVGQLRARMDTIDLDRNKVLAILSSMVEGVVAVDRSEKVLHLNRAAARVLEVDPDSAVGKNIADVTGAEEAREILARAAREARPIGLEAKLYGKSGKRRVEMRASPLWDSDGGLAGAVLVIHDVTELRRLEAVRRDFVANVSHELKTPVTAIRGLVETLIDDEAMAPETKRDFLRRVRDQSLRLSAIITDLLTVSRVESGEWAPEPERIDLREPAQRSMRALRPAGERKGLAMGLDLPEEPVFAHADMDAMRQVIDNLLDNAVKYTPEKGRVTLRVRPDGEDALVEVEDTGVGISPKLHGRIFERFYRVDKARSREVGGTGLGLAIVKHLVQAQGGSVSVESDLERGSVFRVRIPSGPPTRPEPPLQAS